MHKIEGNPNEMIEKMASAKSDEEAVLKFQGLVKMIGSKLFKQKN